ARRRGCLTAGGKRPREKGNSHRGLAFPFGGSSGGNAAHIIQQSKGAQNRPVPRPFLLPEGPHRSEGEDQQWGQQNCGLARAGNSHGRRHEKVTPKPNERNSLMSSNSRNLLRGGGHARGRG